MVTQPIRPAKAPSWLNGQTNGMLDRALLAPVDGNTSLSRLMEARLAAPSMRMLHVRMLTLGFEITTTGRYRSAQDQWDIFGGYRKRYEPCSYAQYLQRRAEDKAAGRKNTTKIWPTARRLEAIRLLGPQAHPIPPDATYWRMIPNANGSFGLNSAVPFTSNHGTGISDDLAQIVIVNNVRKLVALQADCRQALYSVIEFYGFAWETVNDPPHVSWFLGDEMSPAMKEETMTYRLVQFSTDPFNADPVKRVTDAATFIDLGNGHLRWVLNGNLVAQHVQSQFIEVLTPTPQLRNVNPANGALLLFRGEMADLDLDGAVGQYGTNTPDSQPDRTTAAMFRKHHPDL
jgi:hypothetical protein